MTHNEPLFPEYEPTADSPKLYLVFHPTPMIMHFTDTDFYSYVPLSQYNEKYGNGAAQNNKSITRVDHLEFCVWLNDKAARLKHDPHSSLEISPKSLMQMIIWFAANSPNLCFTSPKDLKYFFEKHANSLNKSESFIEDVIAPLAHGTPVDDATLGMMQRIWISEQIKQNRAFWRTVGASIEDSKSS